MEFKRFDALRFGLGLFRKNKKIEHNNISQNKQSK